MATSTKPAPTQPAIATTEKKIPVLKIDVTQDVIEKQRAEVLITSKTAPPAAVLSGNRRQFGIKALGSIEASK
jgi:hypothetical protein